MSHDRPLPRKSVPDSEPVEDERDETIDDDPTYDPAKQAPVDADDEDVMHDMVDVERQDDVHYDLEDETD